MDSMQRRAIQGYLAHKRQPPLGPYSRPMPRVLWWLKMLTRWVKKVEEEEEEIFPAPTENASFLPFVVRYLKLAGQVRFYFTKSV